MVMVAFACLGILIGVMVGISAESSLSVMLPLLFAFGGGSAIAFLHKIPKTEVRRASAAIAALSLSCLAGLSLGIVAAERQWLTPASQRAALNEVRSSVEARKYLRTSELDPIALIDQRYQGHLLTAEQAYDSLYFYVIRHAKP